MHNPKHNALQHLSPCTLSVHASASVHACAKNRRAPAHPREVCAPARTKKSTRASMQQQTHTRHEAHTIHAPARTKNSTRAGARKKWTQAALRGTHVEPEKVCAGARTLSPEKVCAPARTLGRKLYAREPTAPRVCQHQHSQATLYQKVNDAGARWCAHKASTHALNAMVCTPARTQSNRRAWHAH